MEKFNKSHYEAVFGLSSIKAANNAKDALEQALRARENEIALFWKRSGFFLAFIVSAYTAYFFVEYGSGAGHHPHMSVLLLGLAYFLCLSWHLANKGSKFWQKNWEFHVNQLATQQIGPLFRVYKEPHSGSQWIPLSEYDFSVSKICIFISFVMTLLSGWLFSYQLLKMLRQEFDLVKDFLGDWRLCGIVALCFVITVVLYVVGIFAVKCFLQGNNHEKINSAVIIEHEQFF